MKRVRATIMVSLLSVTCTPVSSNCTIALSQDASPIEPVENDPPKSLDELLGIDEESEEKKSLLDERDRKNLEDRLQEREISSDLESAITDMSRLFRGKSSFNGDISSWDVSSVTDMQ